MSDEKRSTGSRRTKQLVSSIVGAIAMIYSLVTFFSDDNSGGEHTAPYVFASYIFIFIAAPLTFYAIHLYRTGASVEPDDSGTERGGVVAWLFLGLMVLFGIGAITMGWHGIESRKVKSFCAQSVGIAGRIEDIEARAREMGFVPTIHVDDVTDESSKKLAPSGRLTVMKTVAPVHFICGVYYEHGLVVKKGFYTLD